MLKTIIAGVLLFIVMVCTAVTVSNMAPEGTSYTSAATGFSRLRSQPILDNPQPLLTSGSGGWLEDNPFGMAAGLVLILCVALGFWQYHHILEDRREAEQAAQVKERKSKRFKYLVGGKEMRQ